MDQKSGENEESEYQAVSRIERDPDGNLVIFVDTKFRTNAPLVPEWIDDEKPDQAVYGIEINGKAILTTELLRQRRRKTIERHINLNGADDLLAPPKSGQFFLSIFTPLQRQEEVIGDLDERFVVQVGRYGLGRARLWYFTQTAFIGCEFGVRKVLEIVGLAKLLGMIRS